MTDLHETLQQLAELEPSDASLKRGSERARVAIHGSDPSPHSFAHPQLRRWIMRSSLAAAVLMALIIGLVTFTSVPTPSFAQELREIAAAQEQFEGWVVGQIKMTTVGRSEAEQMFFPEVAWSYQQPSTGRELSDEKFNGRRVVEFMDPVAGTVTRYDSEDAQVLIGPMDADLARTLQSVENQIPITFPQMLALYEKLIGIDALPVERREEEGLVRYDIEFTEAQRRTMQANHAAPVTRVTVWVDPQTQRTLRTSTESAAQEGFVTMDISYTYRSADSIRSVYDIGVPRDVETVDRRPKAGVNDLLDELDRRYETGLGDVAAVLTETYGEERAAGRERGALKLLVHRGEDWLALEYLVAVDPVASSNFKIQAPKGWPRPGVADAFAAMRDITPYRYVVVNDGHGWQGEIDVHRDKNPIDIRNVLQGNWIQTIPKFRQDESLAGLLWKSRKALIGYNPDTQLELIENAEYPDYIGLRRTVGKPDPHISDSVGIDVHWFDSMRDYLAVGGESTLQDYVNGKPEGEARTIRRGSPEFKKLDNGRWMPSYWSINKRHYELAVDPESRIDESWFTDPLERLGLDAPEAPQR